MNFTELAKKLKEIQDGGDLDIESPVEMGVEECGGDMGSPVVVQGHEGGEHTTTMNVTINSQGVDGIRDLMNILKGISSEEPESSHDDIITGHDDEHAIVIGDNFKNSVKGDKGKKVHGLDTVIFTGDDLASKGRETVKANGGGNPLKLQHHESLVKHLSSLYEDVKSRSQKKR